MSYKQRGAGQPREYSAWEWGRGYLALVLTSPIYAFLWAFAKLCPQLPARVTKLLLINHIRTTALRARDVRIPFDPKVQPYMLRWWKIPRNWAMNIYYHIVKRSDDDRALHDHPWWNFSIILEGGYFEHMILPGGVHDRKWYGPGAVRFRWHGKIAHRLELNWRPTFDAGSQTGDGEEIPVKTIFITGPVLRRWGFHHEKRWVDAYEFDGFMAEHGIAGMKMEGYAEQLKGPKHD
jgi:hypothetical protein